MFSGLERRRAFVSFDLGEYTPSISRLSDYSFNIISEESYVRRTRLILRWRRDSVFGMKILNVKSPGSGQETRIRS